MRAIYFKALLAVVLIAAMPTLAQRPSTAAEGPFGFYAGETLAQVTAVVGRNAVTSNDGTIVRLSRAPKPHTEFESFTLMFSPTKGLLKVVATGVNINNDASGVDLREHYNRIFTMLDAKYGAAQDTFDFIESGSIWNDRLDFMMGLAKKERVLAADWKLPDNPQRLRMIGLESSGLDRTTGYISVEYEFVGFVEFREHQKSSEDSAL